MGKQAPCGSLPSLTPRGGVDGERPRVVSVLLTLENMDMNCLGPLRRGLFPVVNTTAPHEWLVEPVDVEPQIQGAGLNHMWILQLCGGSVPLITCVVQGSAVYLSWVTTGVLH